MSKATLIVMAAGMGSRYGGLKQIDPVGPNGEIILDYSVYDAAQAGFDKVIFVIKHEIEEDFKKIMDGKYDGIIETEYAYQDINNLPEGFSVPEGRVKPWGTGHAVLSCKGMIDGPFAVINSDDYYGRETFKLIYDELTKQKKDSDKYQFCMVGFKIKNTITENGHVSRGVCQVGEDGYLQDIVERTKIQKRDGAIMFTEDDENWTELPEDNIVSMNCWGFSPEMMTELDTRFVSFLKNSEGNMMKCEYLLPFVVDDILKEGKAQVKVLSTSEKWYGVTYKEDKESVMKALKDMTDKGIYPDCLWSE